MLLAMLIAARLLGPLDFGGLVAVQGTVTLLSSIVAYAMRLTATSELAAAARIDRDTLNRALSVIVWSTTAGALILAALGAALAGPIADHVLARADLGPLLVVGSLLLLVDCAASLQLGILTGLRQMRPAALSGAIASVALIASVGSGTKLGGLNGAMWGLVVGGATGVVARSWPVLRVLRRERISPFVAPRRADLHLLRRVSLPVVLMNALWTPTTWAATILLIRSPGGYVQMGHLGAANQWFGALLFLPNVLGFATLPMLSESIGGTAGDAFRQARRLALRACFVAAIPLALGIIAASPFIMGIYGVEYREAWPVLVLLALASVPAAIFSVLANVLTVTGRWARLVGSQLAWAVAYLAVTYLLLHYSQGAAALAAAMLVGNLFRVWIANRRS
jgi:EPS I polysaccharide export inner membrane protein EpsE